MLLQNLREVGEFSVPIAASAGGDNTLLAAQGAGKVIVPIGFQLSASGAVNAKLKSGATDKTGLYYMDAAGAGVVVPESALGLWRGGANEALVLNLSGGVAVGGLIYGRIYQQI